MELLKISLADLVVRAIVIQTCLRRTSLDEIFDEKNREMPVESDC